MTDAGRGDETIPLRLDLIEPSSVRPSDPVVIAVAGDLDMHSAHSLVALARTALDGAPTGVRISIADAVFIDSGGLRALLEIQEAGERSGIPLVLCDVPARACRLLDMTGLSNVLEVD